MTKTTPKLSKVRAIDRQGQLPAPPGRALVVLLVALGCGAALASWIDASQSHVYVGHMKAITTSVASDRDGRIERIIAEEGTTVEIGDPLVILADIDGDAQLRSARRDVNVLRAELERRRAGAAVDLTWRLKEIEAELLETRLKLARYLQTKYDHEVRQQAWGQVLEKGDVPVAAGRSDASGNELKSTAIQAASHGESRTRALLQQETARNAGEVAAAQVELCEQRLAELKKLKVDLSENVANAAGVAAAKERLAAAEAELKRLEANQSMRALKSPAYGVVGTYRRNLGDAASAGEPIVEILDNDRRYVAVSVPSRQLFRFSEESAVELEFPGGVERKGRVSRIPLQTVQAAGDEKAAVLVRVEPIGRLWPIVPVGSEVIARIAN